MRCTAELSADRGRTVGGASAAALVDETVPVPPVIGGSMCRGWELFRALRWLWLALSTPQGATVLAIVVLLPLAGLVVLAALGILQLPLFLVVRWLDARRIVGEVSP